MCNHLLVLGLIPGSPQPNSYTVPLIGVPLNAETKSATVFHAS